MELQALDDKFFKKVLSSYYKDPDIKIVSVKFESGSAEKIHHYASSMEKVTIEFNSTTSTDTKTSVIVKQAPINLDATVLKLNYQKAFATEIKIYSEVFPKIEELLLSIEDTCKLAPTLLYSSSIPNPIVVLEDLNSRGYKVSKSFLNLSSTRKVTEKLAKFHAGSLILQERKLINVAGIKNSWFHINQGHPYDLPKNVLEPHFNYFWQYFKNEDGFQEIAKRLELLSPTFLEKLRKVFCKNNNEGSFLQVLNHGDFHFGNLMHLGEDAEDFLMIDFQFSCWTTPAADIFSLIHLVADDKSRIDHREEILTFYFDTLVQTLQKLGYSKSLPTFDDFIKDLNENRIEELRQIFCGVKFNFMGDVFVSKEEREKDRFTRSRLVFEKPGYRSLVKRELERLMKENVF